ncbi:M20 family metallopeptidase [Paenalcaligenes niemegkensis]|uniref:M20 aminoacylase family protein n=1 Tax=Paenalcaligenes niemegkensis TaxID=2895469 RepID=UPI001EE8E466|nr:M20 aminoacylase family protein [Paenalcaligenes niemegkensis]MCQ9615880.1 M20 family metallopeptidase [Paenalcaligenes niemegkensis]
MVQSEVSTTLLNRLRQFQPELALIRQDIHRHPELGFAEHRTASIVSALLQQWGIEVHTGVGRTGVVGVLHGAAAASDRAVGLRADMDALPIQEQTQLPYESVNAGVMHACGHDGHTAVLLGAARYLAEHNDFSGTVHFIFQPAEEGLGGAQAMLDEGLFERFPCDAVYALHNWPSLPAGVIGVNSGPMMAAADRFEITVTGRGGHGAHAYLSKDPVVVAAHLITALQTIVSRNVPAMESAVLTVSAVQAGNLDAHSVIPQEAKMTGTVRSFCSDVQHEIIRRMQALCDGAAVSFDAGVTLDYHRLFPATINTPAHAERVVEVAQSLFGDEKVVSDLRPSMGAEDFSFMLARRPGAYFRLGQGGAELGRLLHNTKFDFNDAVLPAGSAMFVQLALRYLADPC